MGNTDNFLTLLEVAKILHVHVNTVRRLVFSGRLPAVRVSERGDLRIRSGDLDKFLAARAVVSV